MLNYASRISVRNWAKNPDVAMCVSFCTGCRYGGSRNNLPEYVQKQQVPILILGDTPNETKTDYRLDFLCDGKERNKFNLFIGYGKRLLRNPSYFNSIKTLYYQYLDFTAKMGKKTENIFRPL